MFYPLIALVGRFWENYCRVYLDVELCSSRTHTVIQVIIESKPDVVGVGYGQLFVDFSCGGRAVMLSNIIIHVISWKKQTWNSSEGKFMVISILIFNKKNGIFIAKAKTCSELCLNTTLNVTVKIAFVNKAVPRFGCIILQEQ